jgi:hypothetical protein
MPSVPLQKLGFPHPRSLQDSVSFNPNLKIETAAE